MPHNLHVSPYFLCVCTVVSKVNPSSKAGLPPFLPFSLFSGTSPHFLCSQTVCLSSHSETEQDVKLLRLAQFPDLKDKLRLSLSHF